MITMGDVTIGTNAGPTFDGDKAQVGASRYRWQGTPNASPSEEYTPAVAAVPGTPTGKPMITITAVDAIEQAQSIPSPYAYTTAGAPINSLRQIMAAQTIPWRYHDPVNNYTYDPVVPDTAAVAHTDDDGTLWDQLNLLAAAPYVRTFCDRYGYLTITRNVVNDRVTADALQLDDQRQQAGSLSFKDVQVGSGASTMTNQVTVKERKTGKTFGPYQARSAARRYGVVAAEIELITALGPQVADQYLRRLARGPALPRSVTFDALETDAWAARAAWSDVYTPARLQLRSIGLDQLVTVIGIDHEIEAHRNRQGGRWETTLAFRSGDVYDNTLQIINVTAPEAGDSGQSATDVEPNYGPIGTNALSAAQSIPSGSTITAALGAGATALGGVSWDNSNSRFSVPRRGRYQVSAQITYKPGATSGYATLLVAVNGTAVKNGITSFPASGTFTCVALSTTLALAANDVVSILTSQQSGATRQLHEGNWTFLDVTYLGD